MYVIDGQSTPELTVVTSRLDLILLITLYRLISPAPHYLHSSVTNLTTTTYYDYEHAEINGTSLTNIKRKKVKVGFFYSAAYAMTGPARFTV